MVIGPSPAEYIVNSYLRKTPSIAVVIPYYNGSKFIERAINSVLAQTVPASEFIIVDDGSTEAEAALLDQLAKKYEVRVLHKPNGGQGSARNAGVAATTSDLICFLDQDDYYLGNHNEILLNAIPNDEPRFGWTYADLYEADGDGNVITTAIVRHIAQNPKTSLFDLLRNDMHVLPSASMISRTAFEAVGGFDEQFTGYEDDDLFMRLFRAGYTNHFVDRAVTAWCMHGDSTSYSLRMSRSRLRFFKKMVATFPDDWVKGRFWLRDTLIPRFHRSFVGDAMMAVIKDDRSQVKLYEGRTELLNILDEYVSIINATASVGRRYKASLRTKRLAIAAGSPTLIKAALWGARVWRSLRSR